MRELPRHLLGHVQVVGLARHQRSEEDVTEGVSELSASKSTSQQVNIPLAAPTVPPAHPAVDGKVERVGGADEDVDDKDNFLGNLVVEQ